MSMAERSRRSTLARCPNLGELSRQQIQDLWLDEAQLRDEELEAGTVEAVPGPEVFARIRSRYS